MTKTAKIPNVFQLLKTRLKIYQNNFLTIAGYVTWLLIPYLGLILLKTGPTNHWGIILSVFVVNLFQAFLWLWIIIILTKLIRGWMNKKKFSDEKIMIEAWHLIIPVAVVALIQTAIIAGGLLLFIIPGLIFVVWFAFAQMSVIIDKQHGLKAFSFSHDLVKGRFWYATWKLMGGLLIFLTLFSLLFGLTIAILTPLLGLDPTAIDLAIAAGETPIWMEVISTLSETFIVTPILLIYITLLYEYLKKVKVEK